MSPGSEALDLRQAEELAHRSASGDLAAHRNRGRRRREHEEALRGGGIGIGGRVRRLQEEPVRLDSR